MNRILVISPHPDDESLGCGGTLRKHVMDGDEIVVICLTSGERGGHGLSMEETLKVREAEAREAAKILGIQKIEFWREPDGALPKTGPVVDRLKNIIKEWQPQVIYTTHEHEMHQDHQAAYHILKLALSGLNGAAALPEVRLFEVWTPLQQMDHIVDISEYMETKLAAVRSYKSQCAAMKFDEAVKGLNRYRGEMHSWPGGDYAEIFTEMKF